jgi:hypothetical protein
MECKEPTVVSYLAKTSIDVVAATASQQVRVLATDGTSVHWEVKPNPSVGGSFECGDGAATLSISLNSTIQRDSQTRFIGWRIAFGSGADIKEWTVAVLDEAAPHLRLRLDRVNSCGPSRSEAAIASACQKLVAQRLADFCWDEESFFGDVVCLYAYFKLLWLRRRAPAMCVQRPGWEHSAFIQKLKGEFGRVVVESPLTPAAINWAQLQATIAHFDETLRAKSGGGALDAIVQPLGFSAADWFGVEAF